MSDFLLELRCEEIPARMQAGARRDLEKLFRDHMAAAGVAHGEVSVWSTPRRLALIARGLPEATEAVREEIKGPKVGAPPQALEGFLRKVGLSEDQLEQRDGAYFATVVRQGRATRDVLAWAITAIVRAFPWPKSMRWGAASLSTESLRWVRPLSGIVAILGEDLVECTIGSVSAGYATLGHRFHCPGPITIGGAHDYQEKLRACHVIVDHAERETLIRERAAEAAAKAGLTLVADEGLVVENAGLTEWPVPLLGRFDEAFLEVPPEVIQLTARTNQKYFVCISPLPFAGGAGGGPDSDDSPTPNPSRKREGDLANAFVCTANIEAADGGAAIVDGNRKVLAARLSDARFFWEQDRRKTLEEHAKRLENIVFHEKLGTVADKVERVAKLARWLVEEGIVKSSPSLLGEGDRSAQPSGGGENAPPSAAGAAATSPSKLGEDHQPLAQMAYDAAKLCKADLVTEMVGEFPELQGTMGGYYARAEGLPQEVADAIRDHYKPVGQGDQVPTSPVTVAVSLADKLDSLVSFFAIDERPTGSKDPFALRRSAIAVIGLIEQNALRLSLQKTAFKAGASALAHLTGHEHRAKADAIAMALEDAGIDNYDDYIDRYKRDVLIPALDELAHRNLAKMMSAYEALLAFFADRLKVQQREAGVRHDLIDAVFALGGEDDLVRLLARVRALQAFVGTADGANLLTGYKRAANILKKENYETPLPLAGGAGGGSVVSDSDPNPDSPTPNPSRKREGNKNNLLSYTPEPAERTLIEALDAAEPRARDSVAAEDFTAAMGALASLRGPIDAFFDHVTVNDADPAKRAARLALLARFRSAVHQVADFSKIEG